MNYNEKCKEHQKIKNIICTQCNINTCLICYNKKHKGYIKTSLDDYYKSIKNKYYKSLTQYIKQITKVTSFKNCFTLIKPKYHFNCNGLNISFCSI